MNPIPINAMAGKIPPAPVLAILSRYRREQIEGFISVAIDLLDLADGDPDLEPNGDLEGECSEDGISTCFALAYHSGPGCPISDSNAAVDDLPCDPDGDAAL